MGLQQVAEINSNGCYVGGSTAQGRRQGGFWVFGTKEWFLESLKKKKEEQYWGMRDNHLCWTPKGFEVIDVSQNVQLGIWFWKYPQKKKEVGWHQSVEMLSV